MKKLLPFSFFLFLLASMPAIAQAPVALCQNITVAGVTTCQIVSASNPLQITGGGGGGDVSSFTGDSFLLNNSASTGAVTATLANHTANTVIGALTATTPSDLAVPSCSGASNALKWTSGVGFGCNTISGGTVASSTIGQVPVYTGATTVTGSANFTASAGTITLGTSGTLGSITMGNATTGTLTLEPQAGTLGTTTVLIPSLNSTLVNLASSQTLQNKTLTQPLFASAAGGSTASSTLTLESTTGTGTTDSIIFQTGSQSERMRITTNGNIGIGTSVPDNLLSLDGQAAHTIDMVRETTAATAGNNLTIQAGGAVPLGTNLAGGNLVLSSGIATGTQYSSIQMDIYVNGSTGNSDTTQKVALQIDGADQGGLPEFIFNTSSSTQPRLCSDAGNRQDTGFSFSSSCSFGSINGLYGGSDQAGLIINGTTFVKNYIGSTLETFLSTSGLEVGSATSYTNLLSVNGAASIGASYVNIGAPSNGLIVQGATGIGTSAPRTGTALDLGSNTNSMLLAVGTTGQRPATGINGMVRYNSTLNLLEGYINSTWSSLLSGSSGTPTCGTGCASITAGSTDARGSMISNSSVSSVALNFSGTLGYTPVCTISDSNTTATADISSISTSNLTVGLASALSAVTIYYICAQ